MKKLNINMDDGRMFGKINELYDRARVAYPT